jgi:hypothetical protein
LPRFLSIVLALALTLACGVLYGRLSNRWGPSADVRAAAAKLESIPGRFGDWKLKSREELGQSAVEMLQCVGHVSRVYVHQLTGETVRMVVLLGPPGPIAVHTPEVCLSSQDYRQEEARRRLAVGDAAGGAEDAFWSLMFRAKTLRGDLLRVCYGWSTGGRWLASDGPRYAFAGRPYLYKIQLESPLPPWAKEQTRDPCRRFLADFVPATRQCFVEPALN